MIQVGILEVLRVFFVFFQFRVFVFVLCKANTLWWILGGVVMDFSFLFPSVFGMERPKSIQICAFMIHLQVGEFSYSCGKPHFFFDSKNWERFPLLTSVMGGKKP